jgi:hypothetical protein
MVAWERDPASARQAECELRDGLLREESVALSAHDKDRHLERFDAIGERQADARLQRAFEHWAWDLHSIVQEAVKHRRIHGFADEWGQHLAEALAITGPSDPVAEEVLRKRDRRRRKAAHEHEA